MIRRRRIEITQPFTVVIEPSRDGQGWIGQIIGLPCGPQMTCADTPENTAFMVWDVLRLLTGRCSVDRAEHEYTVDTTLSGADHTPAWGCAHCAVRTAKTEFMDDSTTS